MHWAELLVSSPRISNTNRIYDDNTLAAPESNTAVLMHLKFGILVLLNLFIGIYIYLYLTLFI